MGLVNEVGIIWYLGWYQQASMVEAVCLPRGEPRDADGHSYLEQDIRDEECEQSNIVVVASHLQILSHALDPGIS